MGYIKKLKNNELVGGTDKTTIYPVTSTEAVFEEITNGNESSFKSQKTINKEQQDELDDHEERIQAAEAEDIKSITINGSTKKFEVDDENNVDLTIYTVDSDPDMPDIADNVRDLRNMVGTSTPVLETSHKTRIETLEATVGTGGSVDQRIENAINDLDSQIVVNYGDANPHIRGAIQLADGKLTRFELEENNIASASDLQALDEYTHSIYQTKIEAVSTRPATGLTGIIYRVPNSGGTTYTDWMYNDGWKELATFNIATLNASDINYDNSISGLTADNVQGALDEVSQDIALKADIIDGGIDFSIRDENNNAIVKFANGHIKTKRFNSEAWVKDYQFVERFPDFAIIDENNNGIVKFENGHIKTKKFDSENLTTDIDQKVDKTTYAERFLYLPKTPLFNYVFQSEISSDFSSNSNWSISNERLISINAGVSNRLIHNKSITISQKYTYCKFTIHSDTYFGIGWLSSAFAYDGSLFTINASDGSVNIHETWSSAGTIPNVKYTLPYTFVDGRDYIVKIRKDGHTNYLSIIDCLNGAESETIQSVQTATGGSNEFAGGRQMNKMQLVHLSGVSPNIEYIRCCAAYQEPLVIVYGDSVTEGDRVYNGDTYVDIMKQELGEDRVMCSGQSGSKVADIIARMQFELPLLKPKFVMVTIGSNGSNTQALFNQAKSIILDNNAIPIFNIPPMGVNVLDEIRQFVSNLNVTSARFDIATAVNNDITQGKNSSLFADNTHPNKNGHIAMFKRLKSDCNILFNY